MGAKRGKERRNDAVGSWWKKKRRYGGGRRLSRGGVDVRRGDRLSTGNRSSSGVL